MRQSQKISFLRHLPVLFGLLILTCGCAHKPFSPKVTNTGEIKYFVRFAVHEPNPELVIDAEFQGNATGDTKISLPKELYEEEKPFDGILDFQVLTSDATVSDPDQKGFRTVHHSANELIHLRYKIVQTVKNEFRNTTAMINDQFVHISGQTLFAHPEWESDQMIRVKIEWLDVPKGWILANSFGASELSQTVDDSASNFGMSIFVAGDFDLRKIEIRERPVYLAVRGKWNFTHKTIESLLRKVITAQREFWHDFNVPFYFVLFMSTDEPCCKYAGHGLTHSFVSYFTPAETDLRRFAWVLAHESFHYWNGEKMAPPNDKPLFWFTEGLTDYHAWLLNMRAGVISYDDYVDDVNGQLYRYYSDAHREDADDKFVGFNSGIPQRKGNAWGGNWNLVIQNATKGKKSLDDFMRDVLQTLNGAKLSNRHIETVLEKFVGAEKARSMLQEIWSGKLIQPLDGALGPCSHVKDLETGRYQAGFKDAYSATVVQDLIAASNAEKVGLRNGQKILARKNIDYFKPWLPIELKIQDGDGTRWLKFLPQSRDLLRYPHFVIDQKCRSRRTDAPTI